MEAEVGDELVALEPEAGLCFGFNGVAANVWNQLSAPQSFDQIRSRLLAEYDVDEGQCTTELEELLDQFVEKGLVRCTNG